MGDLWCKVRENWVILALWVVFNLLDTAFTAVALSYGSVELNPVIEHLASSLPLLISYKLSITLAIAFAFIVLVMAARIRRFKPIKVSLCMAVLVMLGLLGFMVVSPWWFYRLVNHIKIFWFGWPL